jgi:hemoglobin-like flavoprotein
MDFAVTKKPAFKVSRHPLYASADPTPDVAVDDAMIARLEASFGLLAASKKNLAECFYARLFKAAPGLRGMFPKDMTAQQQKLTAALAMVVAHLRQPNAVRASLEDMGRRHVGYGVKAEHYPIVAEHLVGAMAEVGGDLWTRDLHDDWASSISMVGAIMMRGAESAKA